MGIYVYSVRAKTINLIINHEKVSANLYSYAYRYTSMWRGDYGYNSYKMTESNTERNAQNVFGDRQTIPYVIVGDLKTGLDDCSVYANVTKPVHYDTDKFPGTFIGWTKKATDNRYYLCDQTEWTKGSKVFRDNVWVPIRTRSIIIDGVCTYQSEDLPAAD